MITQTENRFVRTLCEDIDQMLGEGVPVGQLTEFCMYSHSLSSYRRVSNHTNVLLYEARRSTWNRKDADRVRCQRVLFFLYVLG
jgi:hypothetical protein